MENKPITDEQLAELDRLFDQRRECNKDATKWAQSISICYRPLRQRLTDAEARLEMTERERDEAIEQRSLARMADYADELLVARDDRMKREGAAEWLGGYLQGLSAGNPGAPGSMVAILEAELKRLRERGE